MNRARTIAIMAIAAIAAAATTVPRTIVAQVPAELRGHVTDASTGRPVDGATVTVEGRAETVTTATDGDFVLRGLEPRTYSMRVRALGYAPSEQHVEMVNGRVTTLEIALRPTAVALGPVVVDERTAASGPGGIAFDRAAIDRSGKRDVGELLQTVSGVVVTQAGGPGAPTTISIRGSSPSEVLVLIDGVPANSATSGTADLSRIDLSTVARVTVLPGAQSARYGSRALAGVVLIETRSAERAASLSASAGSWGERNAGASLGTAGDLLGKRFGASIDAQRRDVTGDFAYNVPAVRGGGMARRSNEDVRSTNIAGSATVDGDNTGLRAHTSWESTDRGVAGTIVQPSSTGRATEDRLAGAVDAHTRRGLARFEASVGMSRERAHFADPDPPFGSAYDDAIDASTVHGSGSATVAGQAGTATVGLDVRRLSISSSSLGDRAPGSERIGGVWLGARRTLVSRDALDLSADATARIDWDSLLSGAEVSPRATLTASRGRASLSLSAGNAFSPPSLADQFFHEGVLVRANPNLEPERVRGEIELRSGIRDVRAGPVSLEADAAAYRADVRGMILWMPDFRFIWSPANFDVHRDGFEASAIVGAPATGLSLRGQIDATRVTYTGGVLTGQVAYRPETTGNVALNGTWQRGGFDLTTRYVGARRTVAGSALNLLDPYWLTDVRANVALVRGARHAWRADATLGLTNVFDRPASMLVDYPFGGRRWTAGLALRRGDAVEP